MYVLDMEKQSVRDKKLLLALKNLLKISVHIRYWSSMQLKMSQRKYTPLYEKDTE